MQVDIAAEADKAAARLGARSRSRSRARRASKRLYKPKEAGSSGWDNQEADPRGLIHPGYKNTPGMKKESGPESIPQAIKDYQAKPFDPRMSFHKPGFGDKLLKEYEAREGKQENQGVGDTPIGNSSNVFGSVPVLGECNWTKPQPQYFSSPSEMPSLIPSSPGNANGQGSFGGTIGSSNPLGLPTLIGGSPSSHASQYPTLPGAAFSPQQPSGGGFFQPNPGKGKVVPPPFGGGKGGGMSSFTNSGGQSLPSPAVRGGSAAANIMAARNANKAIRCKEYAAFRCDKGKRCPFSHENIKVSMEKTSLCKYYMTEGSCMNGNSCNWAHGMDELRRV